ncbi:hypothetical protein [Streptomyces sp. LNU-CPARS28]|uniref:Uncharacterized protein n=1 Tax=Streptomyces alboflavus TaxID=67267 RepID=A0A1Z1WI20_9ACTN|nr:hypothetical protein SMD44_05478 [Streptomyces alboflavus]
MFLPALFWEAGASMKAAKELSPECAIGLCRLCPGDKVPVYALGKRSSFEAPLFVSRCDHGCRHDGRAVVSRKTPRTS